MLLAFFMLGSMFTRYKYNFKFSRGIAEGKRGIEDIRMYFVIHLQPLRLQLHMGFFPAMRPVLLAAYLGSVATACGDTLASEIGETYKGEPRMITTLKKTKRGTDGAVSMLGEGAAFFGSLVIALLAYILIPKTFPLYLSLQQEDLSVRTLIVCLAQRFSKKVISRITV